MDWLDLHRKSSLRFLMVSQTAIDHVIGELEGVELSGSSLTAGYYTDTRTSGTLKVHGGNYVRGSFIRVVLDVAWESGDKYSRELGTYIVTDDDGELDDGEWVTTLTLASMLSTLSTDVTGGIWSIGAGADAKEVIGSIMTARGCQYVDRDALSARVPSTVVLESGKSQLEKVFAITGMTSNRIDVDGHGRIVLSKYARPAERSSELEISLTDPRGIVHDGLAYSTDYLSIPNRYVVTYSYSDNNGGESDRRAVSAFADLADGPHSIGQRGYVVSEVKQVNELVPQTYEHALDLARAGLKAETELVEWQLTTEYLPIWEGSIVTLDVPSGPYAGRRKCLVKSLDIALDTMQMKITLKETASGDDDD